MIDDDPAQKVEPATPCIENEGHQQSSDVRFQRWSSMAMNFISMLLFLATATLAVLGFMQWRTMNMSVQQNGEMIRLAKQQADASEKAALAASDSALAARQSTRIAEQAASIAKREYLSERMVIWKARYDDREKRLFLSPMEPGIKLQEAFIYSIDLQKRVCLGIPEGDENCFDTSTPELIHSRAMAPLFEINLDGLLENCCERIGSFSNPKYVSAWESVNYFPIPVIVSALYVAKGELQENTSLYYIQVNYQYDKKKSEHCGFRFLEMFFVRNLDKKENMLAVLRQQWRTIIKKHSGIFSEMKSLEDLLHQDTRSGLDKR